MAPAGAGVIDAVEVIQAHSKDVCWEQPISFLLIDGLHDYLNVSRDFSHFEPWLAVGAHIAFHDYVGYFPGVVAFVDELVVSGKYERISCVGTMILLRKMPSSA